MAGGNQAVTQNGEQYNKLARPDAFVASLAGRATAHENDAVTCPQPLESAKRTLDEADIDDEPGSGTPFPKRSRVGNAERAGSSQTLFAQNGSKMHRPVNADYGMHSMFPGMMDEHGSDDDTGEALAYLRSVRSEAHSIPPLLVAASRSAESHAHDRPTYHSARRDTRAVFEDGAWIARDEWVPESSSQSSSTSDLSVLDAQEQYYKQLLRRYEAQRKQLQRPPHPAPLPRADKVPEERIVTTIPKNRHEWLHVLDREYPAPVLLSCFDEQHVFRGLKYCAHSLDRFDSITRQKSCWIWALLAKAPEPGVLDYVKVGSIRDLGHKAGQFGMRLRRGVPRRTDGDQEDEEEGEYEVEGDGLVEEASAHSSPAGSPERKELKGEELPETSDGPTSREHVSEGSEAEMSMSEDEPKTLEEARARLLAQLGDRLVQPHSSSARQEWGMEGTEKANGTISEATECAGEDQAETASSGKPFNSRYEAEMHRQQLREQAQEHKREVAAQQEEQLQREAARVDADAEKKDMAISDWNTKATIDMILTVVAERYGQRDLLRFREWWAE